MKRSSVILGLILAAVVGLNSAASAQQFRVYTEVSVPPQNPKPGKCRAKSSLAA